jgi:hypothetical protein
VKKVIIAGGRDFNNYMLLYITLGDYMNTEGLIPQYMEIVSGGAVGADELGELFANRHNIELTIMKAEWAKYGRSAGYKRNVEMANYADYLIAFWNGNSKGTKHMIDTMKKLKKPVYVVYYD